MPNLVYYDTSIWIAYLRDADRYNAYARQLFAKTRSGEHQLFISDLTVIEVIHALRHIITNSSYHSTFSEIDKSTLVEDIINSVDLFLAELNNLTKKGDVIYANP